MREPYDVWVVIDGGKDRKRIATMNLDVIQVKRVLRSKEAIAGHPSESSALLTLGEAVASLAMLTNYELLALHAAIKEHRHDFVQFTAANGGLKSIPPTSTPSTGVSE